MSVHVRTAARRYDAAGEHTGPGEWLDVIREANRIHPELFGVPDTTAAWWAGGSVEEYADVRVIHRDDESVSLVSKTAVGADVLLEAAQHLGIVAMIVDTFEVDA